MSHFEELLQCPYDRSHRILPHAMQRHLVKCRKNNPSMKLVSCPFNTVHRVPEPELKLHQNTCEDRATFDLYKYCISSEPSSNNSCYKYMEPELIYHDTIGPQKPGITLQDDDECWDDFDLPAYNPQKYCESAKIIRKASRLMQPAEKQKFYREEYQRHQELNLDRERSKSQSVHKEEQISFDRPSFKGYRGSVPELEDHSKWTKAVPKKSWRDRSTDSSQPSKRKQFTGQQRLYSPSKNIGKDVDKISEQFSRKISVEWK